MMKKSVILVEKNPENERKEDEYQESLLNSKGKDKPSDMSVCTKIHSKSLFFGSEFEGLCLWLKFII